DGPQGGGTDVVLHAFDVIMNHVLVEAQESEEIGEQLVPPRNIAGESLASDRQNQPAILLVFEEPITVEALDHVRYAGLRNFEALGDIDHPRVSLGIDQFEDPFEVILHGRGIPPIVLRSSHSDAKVTGLAFRSK